MHMTPASSGLLARLCDAARSFIDTPASGVRGRAVLATVFVQVTVRPRTAAQYEAFETAVQADPSIVGAHRLVGNGDYMLEIRAPHPVSLAKLKADVLEALPGYVDGAMAVVERTVVSLDAMTEALTRPRLASANHTGIADA